MDDTKRTNDLPARADATALQRRMRAQATRRSWRDRADGIAVPMLIGTAAGTSAGMIMGFAGASALLHIGVGSLVAIVFGGLAALGDR